MGLAFRVSHCLFAFVFDGLSSITSHLLRSQISPLFKVLIPKISIFLLLQSSLVVILSLAGVDVIAVHAQSSSRGSFRLCLLYLGLLLTGLTIGPFIIVVSLFRFDVTALHGQPSSAFIRLITSRRRFSFKGQVSSVSCSSLSFFLCDNLPISLN